ncbi:hypothetical protein ACH42_12760 [Endozoicomonas sp. (ex Bugula neritina AB1)]|nr:hypothetical protein ACH42_12760 [Endozoicomonas sp. (ex Bugula neritina AB1)]
MNFIKKHQLLSVSTLALAIAASNATAGGFEKATLWDAKYSALAGAAVSSVDDSSAIFFNPAGLAFAESNDIALHLSPTFTKVNGPAGGSDTYIEGENNFVPSSGFTGLYKLNEKFTMGYGVYASGGASASYEGVTVGQNIGPYSSKTGDYSTTISIVEAGLAMAYRINNNWSVGGTYRITYAAADINLMSATGPAGASIQYNDMSGFEYFGVRLGAMYRSDDNKFGWGINYRSEVSIDADGNYKADIGAPAPIGGKTSGNVTASTMLPTQVSVGMDYAITHGWTIFNEVTWSNYENIDAIKFTGDDSLPITHINTGWNNQINVRFAGEYTGIEGWALRGGYILTLPVVPEELAAPTFSTPANAHTITFGAGTTVMEGKVDLDFAAEYNYAKNEDVSGGGTQTNTGTKSPSGKYRTSAYAFHVSAKYKF